VRYCTIIVIYRGAHVDFRWWKEIRQDVRFVRRIKAELTPRHVTETRDGRPHCLFGYSLRLSLVSVFGAGQREKSECAFGDLCRGDGVNRSKYSRHQLSYNQSVFASYLISKPLLNPKSRFY
jgi:hypothetical protein